MSTQRSINKRLASGSILSDAIAALLDANLFSKMTPLGAYLLEHGCTVDDPDKVYEWAKIFNEDKLDDEFYDGYVDACPPHMIIQSLGTATSTSSSTISPLVAVVPSSHMDLLSDVFSDLMTSDFDVVNLDSLPARTFLGKLNGHCDCQNNHSTLEECFRMFHVRMVRPRPSIPPPPPPVELWLCDVCGHLGYDGSICCSRDCDPEINSFSDCKDSSGTLTAHFAGITDGDSGFSDIGDSSSDITDDCFVGSTTDIGSDLDILDDRVSCVDTLDKQSTDCFCHLLGELDMRFFTCDCQCEDSFCVNCVVGAAELVFLNCPCPSCEKG